MPEMTFSDFLIRVFKPSGKQVYDVDGLSSIEAAQEEGRRLRELYPDCVIHLSYEMTCPEDSDFDSYVDSIWSDDEQNFRQISYSRL